MSLLDDGALSRLSAFASGEGALLGDRFELSAPIGEGGMGVVWSAWDRQAEREVAVKVLRHTSSDARARFAREIAALDALDALDAPVVPRPIAHGTSDDGAPYLVMERLAGRTLAELLARGPLAIREAVKLGRSAARALSSVHAAGLVHRDVKPTNLFLVGGDPADLRLLDFGLARGRDGLRVTRTGALLGTPGYMAPEQVRGDAVIPAAADVFSLGAVIHECVAGAPAFFADDAERVLTKILLEAPPLLRSIRSAAPPALEILVASMLAKDPALRPGAAAVERDLAALEAALGDDRELSSLPAVGSLVGGKYRVEGTLGEGGMGVILAATHEELGRPVALKLLRSRRGGEDEARLYREARALSRIESEHAARVLDVGRLDDGAPYLVIERLEGADLGRVLRERAPLSITDVARWVIEAGKALAEAHALGIIHRDLKPGNLFLTRRRDGSACIKVLDFGISKVIEESAPDRTLTAPSAVLGSPWYMSPEQLTGDRRVDARTDVWALGVVLHELITGAPPFDASTAAGVGARIAAGAPARLREARPEAPEALEQVVLRCLEKDPDARFQTVADLSGALAPLLERAPITREKQPAKKRLGARTILVALTLALALIAATLALWPRPPVARPSIDAPPPPSAGASVVIAATAATSIEPVPSAAPVLSAPAPTPARPADPRPNRPSKPVATAAPRSVKTAEPRPPPSIDVRDPALDGR